MPARAVYVTVLDLLGGGVAHFDDSDIEVELFAGEFQSRLIEQIVVDQRDGPLFEGGQFIDKLNLHSRAELMRYAVRSGLLRDPG